LAVPACMNQGERALEEESGLRTATCVARRASTLARLDARTYRRLVTSQHVRRLRHLQEMEQEHAAIQVRGEEANKKKAWLAAKVWVGPCRQILIFIPRPAAQVQTLQRGRASRRKMEARLRAREEKKLEKKPTLGGLASSVSGGSTGKVGARRPPQLSEAEAATRLQAVWRGRLARRQASAMADALEQERVRSQLQHQQQRRDEKDKLEMRLSAKKELRKRRWAATVHIQRITRGWLVRTKYGTCRTW
jgi:hypothetical protein